MNPCERLQPHPAYRIRQPSAKGFRVAARYPARLI
jgi:hypothetical protein